jgi:bifunctional UDP-N-acetylglucosamine pyrophosphorylase/glucosamine-1-phosphate N-acetyltransferase
MQAVIMAAGVGKRMQPLTLDRPKPLIEVAGKPLIEHVIDALPKEIDEVIIVIGYKGEMIKERLGESHAGKKISYVYQWMPAGTAHALSVARPFLKGRFLLLNADDIHGPEAIEEALKHPNSILAARHPEPEKFGVLKVRDDGTMEAVVEKPETPMGNLVSTGAMVLDDRLFGYEAARHTNGEYYMTHPLGNFVKDVPFKVVEQELWIPVGFPEDIEKAEEMLKKHGR